MLLTHFLNLMDKNPKAKFVFESLDRHEISGTELYFLYKYSCSAAVQRFVLFLQALDNGLIQDDILTAVKNGRMFTIDWDYLGDTLEERGIRPWLSNEEAKNPELRRSPYH